jgi:hypothetical protein
MFQGALASMVVYAWIWLSILTCLKTHSHTDFILFSILFVFIIAEQCMMSDSQEMILRTKIVVKKKYLATS